MASPFTPRRKFPSAYIIGLIALIVVGGATLAYLATRNSSDDSQNPPPTPAVATDGQGTDPSVVATPQATPGDDVVVTGTPADLGPTPRPTPSARNSTVIHKPVVSGVPLPTTPPTPIPTATPDLARDSAEVTPAVTPAAVTPDTSANGQPAPTSAPASGAAAPAAATDNAGDNSPYDPSTPSKPVAPAGGAGANSGGY